MLLATLANANPINITVSGGASVVNSFDLGSFGDATVLNWIATDITAYNSLNSITLPAPTANPDGTAFSKVTTGAGPSSITLSLNSSYDYIFLHWGGQGGGSEQLFYIGALTGSFEFDAPPGGHPTVGGLSFYSFYGPNTTVSTPDGASTILLLGSSLTALSLLVHRLKR